MSIRLYPNRLQATRLEHYLFVGRLVYNRALESRIHWYKTSKKSLTFYDQCADLSALRQADDFWTSVPCQVERDAMRRVDLGFKAFFRRIKSGDKPGFPRFKSRKRWSSFSIIDPGSVVKKGRIRVSGINSTIRCRNLRPIEGKIKQQRVVNKAGKWFCQLVVESTACVPCVTPRPAVGIDVGLKTFAMLSDGNKIANPRFGRKAARQLSHAHRNVSRTVKRSRNRRKAVARLQRVYLRVSNLRHNFTHQESRRIADRYGIVAAENLTIANMVRGRLAKSILDACWSQFTSQLAYKVENTGGLFLRVDPRSTTQDCSNCGVRVQKDLTDRVHRCSCGLVVDRDLNAARNVLKRAIKLLAPAAGRADTVMPVEAFVGTPANQEVLRQNLTVLAK